jgi:hypothetical protein
MFQTKADITSLMHITGSEVELQNIPLLQQQFSHFDNKDSPDHNTGVTAGVFWRYVLQWRRQK